MKKNSRAKKRKKARAKKRSKKEKPLKKAVDLVEPSPVPEATGKDEWTKDRISAFRNKLGLTQEQFAHRLGVTYVTVNRWENGRFSPKGLSLEALNRMEREA